MVFTATYKLGSEIAQREVGRQVAHDVDLALGERLGQRVCAPLRELPRPAGLQREDLGDERGVGSAVPSMTREQLRDAVQQGFRGASGPVAEVDPRAKALLAAAHAALLGRNGHPAGLA
jgi:hypothetical protein